MRTKLLIILILLLAFVLRFYNLSQNPPGLYWDEVSNGYNAYSVLKTAKDEYGVFLPTVFRSYDDYKPPVYIYSIVPSIAVFGLNEFAVRFPSAAGGVLTVFLVYSITKKFFQNVKLALFTSFFLAISPWHIQFSRGGFEANFMIFLTILGLYLFLLSKEKFYLLILSAISFGFALETYHGGKVWVPLFILTVVFFWKKELLSHSKKLVLPLLILAIFSLPVFLNFGQSFVRGKSVSIFSEQKTDKIEIFAKGYFAHFSPVFLFIKGDSIGRHSVPGMGQLYIFELPLIIAGIYLIFKEKFKYKNFLIAWLFLAPIPAALSSPTPHALRAVTFIPLWSIISAYGLRFILKFNYDIKIKNLFLAGLFFVGLFNFITYQHLYHKHYPKEKGPDWQDGYRQMLTYVNQIQDKYKTIAISDALGRSYIYTLFYLKYDPQKYQTEGGQEGFGKYEFFNYSLDKKEGRTLIVASTREGAGPIILKEIHTFGKDVAFRIFEQE